MLLRSMHRESRRLAPLLLAAGVLVAGKAAAQAPGAEQMFRSLDADGDGRLTLEEATPNSRNILDQVFRMAGKQAGQNVSRAEFQQVFERHNGGNGAAPGASPPQATPQAPARPVATPVSESPAADSPSASGASPGEVPGYFRLIDADGNGKLSRSEFARLTQFFARLDRDKDGSLDLEELNTAETPSRNPTSTTGGASARTGGPALNAAAASGPAVWRGWVVHGTGENPNAGQMELELTITGNVIRGREVGTHRAPGGPNLGAGNFTMSGDGARGNLDADCTEGQHQGRHYLGIYQVDGDTLRWCVSGREGQRPATMATDRGNYLLVLRRVSGAG